METNVSPGSVSENRVQAPTSNSWIKLLKTAFIVSIFAFILVQVIMRVGNSFGEEDNTMKSISPVSSWMETVRRIIPGSETIFSADQPVSLGLNISDSFNPSNETNRSSTNQSLQRNVPVLAGNNSQNGSMPQDTSHELSPEEIGRIIKVHNEKFEVYNEQMFGPVEIVEYVIAIQVHNRTKYLKELIYSLSQAKGLERALLVFSHDYYSDLLNSLVRSITFSRVMQIFYPYSIQIYPDRFPGQGPNDCPNEIGVGKAQQIKCEGWQTPDPYDHYRTPTLAQMKHHWWWKMNHLFAGIPRLRNRTDWILRLEEDHYVSPDFLHTFDYIVKHKETLCNECHVITLGIYSKIFGSYLATVDQLVVLPWHSSRHSMGMAINRSTWMNIRQCAEMFCSYDDYNWDWTLMRINFDCFKQPMTVIHPVSSRVFHVGDCGIHHDGAECKADRSTKEVKELIEKASSKMFPEAFHVAGRRGGRESPVQAWGGFSDIRDQQLCRNITDSYTSLYESMNN